MPKNRTESAKAAGKLIKEIDRERMEQTELGIVDEEKMESKLGHAHELLQAQTATAMINVLGNKSVRQYFGNLWLKTYPAISAAADTLQVAIEDENGQC